MSRHLHEVLLDAIGVTVGEVERYDQRLLGNPQADRSFWRAWYLGRIPWQRQTVTPASVLNGPALVSVYDGPLGG